jgi:insertion element IS1 protein InsB
MWSFYHDKWHQIRLWRTIDSESGEGSAIRFGTGKHKHPDTPLELPRPLSIGKVYTDGGYAYYERFSPEVSIVTKKNTQKIERKHLSIMT